MRRSAVYALDFSALVFLLFGLNESYMIAKIQRPPESRVAVFINTEEAEAVLAIIEQTAAKASVGEGLWKRLFTCEPYIRLKAREAGNPKRRFTDDDFKRFVLSPELKARAPELRRTLGAWKGADLEAAAVRILPYLPDDARIKVKVYPVIKPKPNSFVSGLETDPAIFLYIDPSISKPSFENTVAHEMHHIGFSSIRAGLMKQYDGLPPGARTAAECLNAFGEGFAMLAAAGGHDIHPHATSRPEDKARWDADMAKFNPDLKELEKFFLDIVEGRLKTEEEISAKGSVFFGVQGAWYTVGYKMSVMVEKRFGRSRLIQCMKDPRLLLMDYNLAAAEYNRRNEDKLALWSPFLLIALGCAAPTNN